MTLKLGKLADRVRVLDGASGTELQRRGLPAGAAPELWNREDPAAVEALARSYVEADSDIILTNTSGANRYVHVRAIDASLRKMFPMSGSGYVDA